MKYFCIEVLLVVTMYFAVTCLAAMASNVKVNETMWTVWNAKCDILQVLFSCKHNFELCELFQDVLPYHFCNLESVQMLLFTDSATFVKWSISVRVLIREIQMQGAKWSLVHSVQRWAVHLWYFCGWKHAAHLGLTWKRCIKIEPIIICY